MDKEEKSEKKVKKPAKKGKDTVKVKKKVKLKMNVGRKEGELNAKQERFCQLYASDKEFFGNGVQSYMEAYCLKPNKKNYASAKELAHRLLTKVYITSRINEIFETRGLNDVFVDKQLEKLITQDADNHTKIQAIKEYNNLKARITQKHELVNPTTIIITRGENGVQRGGSISESDNSLAQESTE